MAVGYFTGWKPETEDLFEINFAGVPVKCTYSREFGHCFIQSSLLVKTLVATTSLLTRETSLPSLENRTDLTLRAVEKKTTAVTV